MASADNTPDFDSMSPDEIMAWMESLAKRQGAKSEELTTSADLEIPEIDPNTVVIDEPGYVPYGEDRPERPAAPVIPSAPSAPKYPPAAPQRPASFEPPAQPARPVAQTPAQEPDIPWRSPAPQSQIEAANANPLVAEPAASPLDDNAMAWLESLAAGQGDALFNLDLNALTDEIDRRAPAQADEPTDPMAWLRSLANEDDAPTVEGARAQPEPTAPEPAAVTDPFASGVDPMAWLENLARRQGARDEELTTATEMHIPVPENPVVEEPGYKPFSFDAPIEPHRPSPVEPAEVMELENPSSWLESLADSQGFDTAQIAPPMPEAPATSLDIDEIEQAIADGTVTPEQMQVYLERQTDVYVESLEHEAEFDGEAPPVPAELPDWLLEQVGPPPLSDESGPISHYPPLTETITEPPLAADLPDWLQEELPPEGELDFDSIFANRAEEDFVAPDSGDFSGLTLDAGQTDPWAEAFDLEQAEGSTSLDSPPDWYRRNLNDPQRLAAVGYLGEDTSATLADARLPEETELPAGELMAVPDWLMTPVEAEPEAAAEMPDWLRELEAGVSPDSIPDWLVETMDEGVAEPETALPVEPEPEPEPEPPPPAPVIARQPEISASTALAEAREHASRGDVAVALAAYESLVHGSHDLEQVVSDLQSLVRQHRSNPAVFRVLGDGLMRQGKLQSALDTYREALNLL